MCMHENKIKYLILKQNNLADRYENFFDSYDDYSLN